GADFPAGHDVEIGREHCAPGLDGHARVRTREGEVVAAVPCGRSEWRGEGRTTAGSAPGAHGAARAGVDGYSTPSAREPSPLSANQAALPSAGPRPRPAGARTCAYGANVS